MCIDLMVAGWILVPLTGIACVVGGYYALVRWIPNSPAKDIRTDVFSARVSCYVIGVGLLIITLWAISTLVIRTSVLLKTNGVI